MLIVGIIFVFLVGGIALSNAMGWWEAECNSEKTIEVKGKTTVKEALSWGLTMEQLEKAVGGPIDNKRMLIKDVCEANGFHFSAAKAQLNQLLDEKRE